MRMNPAEWMKRAGYLVVANIPYYITSALIRHLLEAPIKPGRLVLTVQREVAQRICAQPGDLSLLALGVQVYGMPSIALRIPAGAFYPAPKVDSAVLLVDLYDKARIAPQDMDVFFSLAKQAFSHKRKMLHNALAGYPRLGSEGSLRLLEQAGISPDRRAQTLSLEEWGELARTYAELNQ